VKDLAKKLEEIQGHTSQAKVAQISPVNINPPTVMPRYVPLLGYGATELQVHASSLIEDGRPNWMASNLNIVCYNCKNPRHYESRCARPEVAPEIRAEHVHHINANSGRSRSYPPRSGQNDTQVQQEMEFLGRQVLEMRAGQIAAGQVQIAAGSGQFGAGYA